MAKRKYDLSVVILTLLVSLMPIFGAAGDKVAVIYASLCAVLVALGYRAWKTGSVKITKTALVMVGISLFSYIQLLWVSDKGAQVAFASVFLTAGLAALLIGDIKNSMKEDAFKEGVLSVGYISSLIYGACAFLYQVFIESNFIFGGMDLGKGTSTATAVIMLIGIVFAIKLFDNREKTVIFYPSIGFMGLVFILTGSLVGYLIGAILILHLTMEIRRKRMEALGVLLVIAVLAVLNIAWAIFMVFTANVEPQGAFRGLVSVIGMGKGGYDASVSVLSSGYLKTPPAFLEFMEIWGVLGLGIIGLLFYGAYTMFTQKHNTIGMLLSSATVGVMLTGGDCVLYMAVVLAILFASLEDEKEFKINPLWAAVCIVPILFFALLGFGRIPYMIAKDAADYGKYEKAAQLYAFGAQCSLFDSEPWEKAYICATKAHEEGVNTVAEQNEYIKNALKFNKKNYLYRVYMADVYTLSGNVTEAVELWNGIINRYDRESLYVPYTRALCNMMEKGNVDLTTMENLYSTILEYANKTTDSNVKYEVNNILTESLQYYIDKREGKYVPYEEIVEEATEFETETEYLPQEEITESL